MLQHGTRSSVYSFILLYTSCAFLQFWILQRYFHEAATYNSILKGVLCFLVLYIYVCKGCLSYLPLLTVVPIRSLSISTGFFYVYIEDTGWEAWYGIAPTAS